MTAENELSEPKDRVRVVYVDPHLIVDVLNWAQAPEGSYLALPADSGLPADAEVLSVFGCAQRRAIGCLVHHPSFERVTPGAEPPDHPGWFSVRPITKDSEPCRASP